MKKLSEISLDITEDQYRDMNCISYSFLSKLDSLGARVTKDRFEGSNATEMGNLIEDIVFDVHDRDNYFVGMVEEPGKVLKDAVDSIAGILVNLPEGKKECIKAFEYVLDGNPDIGYYKDQDNDKRAVKIYDAALSYIDYLRLSKHKILMSGEDYHTSHVCANTLLNHSFTKDILDLSNMDSMTQFKGSFIYKGFKIRFMADLVKVDHINKIVWLYDIKTGEKKTEAFQHNYHFFRYDIQDYLYTLGIKSVLEEYYPGYRFMDMRFIYISTKATPKPLIFRGLGASNLIARGYYRNNKFYKGVDELLKDYEWYLKNGFEVEYPEKIYKVHGVVSLDMEGIKIK